MSIWFGKAAVAASLAAIMLIRGPHGQRSRNARIAESRQSGLDRALLLSMWLSGVILPVLWIATSLLSFADYRLHAGAYFGGLALLAPALWLFHRSHADLGINWSSGLEIREEHVLVTSGVYRRVRHPMYAALLLEAVAQALFASNWIVGPARLVCLVVLLAQRLPREESMMADRFGQAYTEYAAVSRRLAPGVW